MDGSFTRHFDKTRFPGKYKQPLEAFGFWIDLQNNNFLLSLICPSELWKRRARLTIVSSSAPNGKQDS